jgi:hypothetical protein
MQFQFLTILSGSYLEIVLTNTTSVYCDLNNAPVDEKDSEERSLVDRDPSPNHATLQPVNPHQKPSRPVSLLVQINETAYGFEDAAGIILIAEDLDPAKTYKLKISHLGSADASSGAVEIDGIWVDKPSEPEPGEGVSGRYTIPALRNPVFPRDKQGNFIKTTAFGWKSQTRKTIEIVTSETALSAFAEDEDEDATDGRLNIWSDHFRKNLSLDMVLIPTSNMGLLPHESSPTTINDIFFRSGPPSTSHFSRPWTFKSYRPSVLILQLGLVDFMQFFADKKNHGDHAINKFKAEMKSAVISFIHNIRATAYPYQSTTEQSGLHIEGDGSYSYNSAPSTLPIFLLVPFTASRRFVTKKQKLHTVISDVLSQVASTLQNQGDKSTFWIDTSGWLDSRVDFAPRINFTSGRTRLDTALLTPFANYKVASLLADHLCPYLKVPSANPSESSNDCQFDRYDNYLGDVYIPQDVDFERAMLERKIAMIKERFNIDSI